MKIYKQPPLPFVGNKKNFIKDFIKIFEEEFTWKNSEELKKYTIIDLFWGSGLLSHNIKKRFPDIRVIYNDYDNYSERIKNITDTEGIRQEIQEKVTLWEAKDKIVDKEKIIEIIQKHKENWKYIDEKSFIWWFSFSWFMNFEDLLKSNFFNKLRRAPLEADWYLEWLEIRVGLDYQELIREFQDLENVIFVFDPPYLNTDNGSYKIQNSWSLKDFLHIITHLKNKRFIFFTSEKSSTFEFVNFLKENKFLDIDFKVKYRFNVVVKGGRYKDIMFYNL